MGTGTAHDYVSSFLIYGMERLEKVSSLEKLSTFPLDEFFLQQLLFS
jgi:hypothetical protein